MKNNKVKNERDEEKEIEGTRFILKKNKQYIATSK